VGACDLTPTLSNDDLTLFEWTAENLAAAQAAGADIMPICDWMLNGGDRPDRKTVALLIGHTRAYWSQWDSLELCDGVVYRKFLDKTGLIGHYQLLTPLSLRSQLIKLTHGKIARHLGIEKTQSQLQHRDTGRAGDVT